MSLINFVLKRGISTSATCYGKKNFKKFPLYNKRGTRQHKLKQATDPYPNLPIHNLGTREIGYKLNGKFVVVPEMIPELIVPDLKNFKLKPYVSYRTPDVIQSEFTSQDLFDVVYAPKIGKDFIENKLKEDGYPMNPSVEENLTPQEAKIRARQTGTDLFTQVLENNSDNIK